MIIRMIEEIEYEIEKDWQEKIEKRLKKQDWKDWGNKIDEIEKTRLKRKIVKLFHCCYCITMKQWSNETINIFEQWTFLNNKLKNINTWKKF